MSTKKFFRLLFALSCVVLLALLVFGLVEPKDVEVKRSVVINSPSGRVFEQMVKFRNWPNWSPWSQMDTSMKNTFEGVDGLPGSIYHWVGSDKLTGEVKITNQDVKPGKINFSFELIKPGTNKAKGMLEARDSSGITVASFSFTNHFDYPWNAVLIFMDLDKTMSKDLVKALDNIKAYSEKSMTDTATVRK